jgi:two-component system nitrogen regulation response regulator GlnG
LEPERAWEKPSPVEGFIGQTPVMQQVFARLALVAASDANVLIAGETGTGKELVARAIHKFSARRKGPFVVVNLAAVTPSLAESELFGHVRGAFTGAEQTRMGLLQQANGGTLFLDEIADIPLSIQVKLLRAVEQKEVLPVGASRPVPTDFRVVGATHRDIQDLVGQHQFRLDLYFRVASFRIDLPPLRERVDDIVPLAYHFLQQFSGHASPPISPAAIDELRRRPWWGNVRELRNAIEHAVIVSRSATIMPEHLPPPIVATRDHQAGSAALEVSDPGGVLVQQIQALLRDWTRQQFSVSAAQVSGGDLYARLLELVEPPVLQTLLDRFGGQVSQAAKVLGLHRTTLRKKVNELRLESRAERPDAPDSR